MMPKLHNCIEPLGVKPPLPAFHLRSLYGSVLKSKTGARSPCRCIWMKWIEKLNLIDSRLSRLLTIQICTMRILDLNSLFMIISHTHRRHVSAAGIYREDVAKTVVVLVRAARYNRWFDISVFKSGLKNWIVAHNHDKSTPFLLTFLRIYQSQIDDDNEQCEQNHESMPPMPFAKVDIAAHYSAVRLIDIHWHNWLFIHFFFLVFRYLIYIHPTYSYIHLSAYSFIFSRVKLRKFSG